MLPLLRLASKRDESKVSQAVAHLAIFFHLTESEREKPLVSDQNRTLFYDRTHWALLYLRHAGLLAKTRRGFFSITPLGKSILQSEPSKISKEYLTRFPGFAEYLKPNRNA